MIDIGFCEGQVSEYAEQTSVSGESLLTFSSPSIISAPSSASINHPGKYTALISVGCMGVKALGSICAPSDPTIPLNSESADAYGAIFLIAVVLSMAKGHAKQANEVRH